MIKRLKAWLDRKLLEHAIGVLRWNEEQKRNKFFTVNEWMAIHPSDDMWRPFYKK